uniref:Uncharacterized protein n=1 Tax=Electrophorus electricus TaxID=8005 RepID=A0AAY5EWK3_ELEEL
MRCDVRAVAAQWSTCVLYVGPDTGQGTVCAGILCSLCRYPLCWYPLCWYSLCRYPLCWYPLCWYSLCRYPLCWYPLCWYSLCRYSLCWYPLCRYPLCRYFTPFSTSFFKAAQHSGLLCLISSLHSCYILQFGHDPSSHVHILKCCFFFF